MSSSRKRDFRRKGTNREKKSWMRVDRISVERHATGCSEFGLSEKRFGERKRDFLSLASYFHGFMNRSYLFGFCPSFFLIPLETKTNREGTATYALLSFPSLSLS
mmetsp:Transcript_18218/g.36939  ORF Transcript_18218/g.36939 Transcript_18218/m.36939 type:complete len:105 (-) Transcript_18218:679-993(-)